MKSESHRNKILAVSRPYDLLIGIGHFLAHKAALLVVTTCFAFIFSLATTSAETVVITDIDVNKDAKSNSVTVGWQSHPDLTYAVFATEDLQTWTQLNNERVPSGGDQTSFTDEAISQKETSRYYRVEESAFAGPQEISLGEVFHLKINPELDSSLVPPTPPYNPPPVVHEGSALTKGAMASIRRNVDGVTVNIKIDDLNPNHAYTTWFVEIGVGGPPPFLAGDKTGDSGEAWFSGHMSAVSPMDGEFHIIIADHGPLNLLPPTYDFTSSMPPIGLDSEGVWKLNWPMVVIFESIGSGEMFHLKINPDLDPSLDPPTPPYNPPAVVHDGSALLKGKGAMASIRRNVDGVSIKIKIDDLNPNHAYTTWFVEMGVGGPPPFLASAITGESGHALFSGDISAVSPMNGEFHIIIADHGPLNLLPPTYDFTSSMPPIGLDSESVWKLNWPMVVIFEPISSGEVFHLKINPELDPSLEPPTPPYNPPAVVHDGGALLDGAKASIRRNLDGVTINIKIDDLNPNHAYTAWFVEMGVGGPPPFLAGEKTGNSGEGWFSGDISAMNPMNGEFHIVIADHGPLNLLPPTYDFTSSMPPIGLDSESVWKLNWPMVVIFEPISSGEVFHLKINPELDPSLEPPTPPYNPPAVVHDGGALLDGAKASIRRNLDGVTINIKIDDLNPNHAYTTWFVEMGVGGPPPFLASAITGESGHALFSGDISAVSPMNGEFHIVIADHGPLNLLPPTYDFTSSVPPIGLDSDSVWKLNWPMVVIFEP